jgi:hypothetical protein
LVALGGGHEADLLRDVGAVPLPDEPPPRLKARDVSPGSMPQPVDESIARIKQILSE